MLMISALICRHRGSFTFLLNQRKAHPQVPLVNVNAPKTPQSPILNDTFKIAQKHSPLNIKYNVCFANLVCTGLLKQRNQFFYSAHELQPMQWKC